MISGQRLTPARLAVITSLLIPLCFLLALTANYAPVVIAGFALGYGAVNGLMTVVKATLALAKCIRLRGQFSERLSSNA
ncbi:hypothetical protein [Scandinavium manionii]|uniref:hypothetical protein n=1 Tax=Scandinavium manionii TaxID=2926520 RepID=UPI001359B0B8|nr:hypothetical protein [Scandinavium manionii]MCS2147131.1 hypothetical protein [Scandinavium manionii]MCS2164851.1 hypothetical protein [Scandinavium manionii]